MTLGLGGSSIHLLPRLHAPLRWCPMTTPDIRDVLCVEMLEEIPVARFAPAPLLFEHAVTLIADIVRQLVVQGRPQLLVDGSQVTFASPSLVDRLRMVREWADAAEGRVRIAMVTRPEYIDPERFGIVAAGNFGLAAQVFDCEEDAVAWLREEHAAEVQRNASGPISPT